MFMKYQDGFIRPRGARKLTSYQPDAASAWLLRQQTTVPPRESLSRPASLAARIALREKSSIDFGAPSFGTTYPVVSDLEKVENRLLAAPRQGLWRATGTWTE